ncbi:MAG: bacillithiol system redox-active protein YtxJ [Acidobacteriota bacterium]
MSTVELTELTSAEALEQVLAASAKRGQLIFKHSLTCPISARAYEVMQQHVNNAASDNVDYWLILVQHARDVSNLVAERLNVEHESPQVILVSEGRAIWNASHFSITGTSIAEALEKNQLK